AKARLLDSPIARETATSWIGDEYAQSNVAKTWTDAVKFDEVAMQDRNGVEWISIHGFLDEGCGGPHVNVWGLYRVAPDGTLVTVVSRALDTMSSLDSFVDLDGDGVPEVVGRGEGFGDNTVVETIDGKQITNLAVAFYGCPC